MNGINLIDLPSRGESNGKNVSMPNPLTMKWKTKLSVGTIFRNSDAKWDVLGNDKSMTTLESIKSPM